MYTSSFEHVKRLGGVVRGGGEDLKKRLDLGSREGLGRRRKAEVVYTGFLEQVWRPGGTVPGGTEAIDGVMIERGSRRSWYGRGHRPGDMGF
jgi:hypothetical protein